MTGPAPGLSPAALALLQRREGRRGGSTIRAGQGGPVAPLAFSQIPQWAFAALFPDNPVFNLPKRLHLRGDVDPTSLRLAIEAIAARHDILHSAFRLVNEEPAQVLLPCEPLDWATADCRFDPTAITERLDHHAARIFSLDRGHLVRGLLVRVADDEWLLQVVFHHIAFDGWSTTVFFDEIGPVYDALRRGESPPLPPLPVQYADYAAWQRASETSESFARAGEFWQSYLKDCRAAIDLPTDRPSRPGTRMERGELVRTIFDAELTGAIRRQAAAAGTTLGATLLAAYAVLLGRRAAQDAVVIGQVAARRTHVELERLIGTFVTTFPVVATIGPQLPFGHLATEVRRASALAHEHGGYPPERLGHLLHPGGVLNRGRVFDAIFNLRSFPSRLPAFATLDVTPVEAPRQAALADVGLEISEHGDRLVCDLDYNPDAFDAVTVRRWAAGYQAVLEAVTHDPGTPVGRLPVMAAEEASLVLTASSGPVRSFEAPALVHHQFEDQARRSPDAPAIRHGARAVSYAELDRWADGLAAELMRRGVGPGAIIGVMGERKPATIASLLAVWKAGAAFLPLDPVQPPERLARMAIDAECTLALATTAADLPGWNGSWLRVPDAALSTTPPSPMFGEASIELDRLAYVVFTSGSTGTPKGVMVGHRSLRNFLCSMVEQHRLGPGDTALQFASLGFDSAFEEIFAPLVSGGAVALAERDELLDPARCAAVIRTAGVTFAALTPSVLANLDPAAVPGLRELMIMGEAADAGLYRAWAVGRRAWNGYGPTEATIGASQGVIDPAAPVISIGPPNANTRLLVVDPDGQPVPFGTPGEICIGGEALARGYLGDPALTAARFVPDPDAPGRRLYRTGDRARRRDRWGVEFLGRVDQQIKIRGQRIELGEIETSLAAMPGVAIAAVLAQKEGGDLRLVGYLEPEPGTTLDPAAIRNELRRRLPQYMVPAAIVALDRLPRTPSRKIDRRALPPYQFDAATNERPTSPQTGFERELIRIWEDLFTKRPIGPGDDFFQLGGHSLLGVRMAAEVKRATGHDLPIATLFRDPTLAGVARALREKVPHAHSPPIIEVSPTGTRRPFFMVHGDVVGGGFYCHAIARAVGGEVPIYAFPPRSELDDPTPNSVEEIARLNLDQVRRIQPRGPYRLGGHCLSGLVAYEMAQQLRRAGEAVELLVLVDTRSGPWRLRRIAPLIRRLVALTTRGASRRRGREALILHRLERLRQSGWAERLQWAAGYPIRFLRRRLVRSTARPGAAPGNIDAITALEDRVFGFQVQLGFRYCAAPYPDPVLFVNAVAGPDARLQAPTGWRPLLPQLELVAAEATHVAVVTSHLPGIIASRLARLDGPP